MSSILEQYREQRRRLATAYIMPTRITFSGPGYTKMMSEADSMTLMLNPNTPAGQPTTYDGLPYSVVNDQPEEIKLHNSMTDSGPQRAIKFAMKGSFGKLGTEEPKTMVEIVAQSLDAATLCDIIMHWLGADPHWGDFEKELHAVVERHGRFE
jgi:hypothetical protein